MNFWKRLTGEPPPACAIEFAERGISFARIGRSAASSIDFLDLPMNALKVSPSAPNFTDDYAVQTRLARLGGGSQRAALILPDYCARVVNLPFDQFPKLEAERIALIKFRLRKSLPFDIETAQVSYHVQPGRDTGKAAEGAKTEVVAAIVSGPVLDQYESALKLNGLLPGKVTLSTLALLDLVPDTGVTLLTRINGTVLTIAVTQGPYLRLYRCIELSTLNLLEVEEAIYPTAAYIEDELKSHTDRLMLCGFGQSFETLAANWSRESSAPVEPLRWQTGTVNTVHAGLAGYLHSLEAA